MELASHFRCTRPAAAGRVDSAGGVAAVAAKPSAIARQRGGCRERAHFAAMVLLHIAILVGAGVEAWGTRRLLIPGLPCDADTVGGCHRVALVGDCQPRPHWNVAIMDSIEEQKNGGHGLTVVCKGPFRWIRHPNYLAVFLELLALPLLHAAWFMPYLGQRPTSGSCAIACTVRKLHCSAIPATGRHGGQAALHPAAAVRGRSACLCLHPSRASSVSAGRVRALRSGSGCGYGAGSDHRAVAVSARQAVVTASS